MSSINKTVRTEILTKCKRYCCKCLTYSGTNIEIHHIRPINKGGDNSLDNLIPLCFNCHSEVGAYSDKHPKGNKFSISELKKIREESYEQIKNLPRKKNISTADQSILEKFKNDYVEIIEEVVNTDFTASPISIDFSDMIDQKNQEWQSIKYKFNDNNLENLKVDIINELRKLSNFIDCENFKVTLNHQLMIKHSSYEEMIRLNEHLRPSFKEIRLNLNRLLHSITKY